MMAQPDNRFYQPHFFEKICPILESCIPGFPSNQFIFRIFDNRWPELNFPERVWHISDVLADFLPGRFPDAAQTLVRVAKAFHSQGVKGHQAIFLINLIEKNGALYPEESARAIAEIRWLLESHAPLRPELQRETTVAELN